MDTIHCQTCHAELPLEDTNVINLQTGGTHYREKKHCCPFCDTVLLLEVTMAEDETPAAASWMALGA